MKKDITKFMLTFSMFIVGICVHEIGHALATILVGGYVVIIKIDVLAMAGTTKIWLPITITSSEIYFIRFAGGMFQSIFYLGISLITKQRNYKIWSSLLLCVLTIILYGIVEITLNMLLLAHLAWLIIAAYCIVMFQVFQ